MRNIFLYTGFVLKDITNVSFKKKIRVNVKHPNAIKFALVKYFLCFLHDRNILKVRFVKM